MSITPNSFCEDLNTEELTFTAIKWLDYSFDTVDFPGLTSISQPFGLSGIFHKVFF